MTPNTSRLDYDLTESTTVTKAHGGTHKAGFARTGEAWRPSGWPSPNALMGQAQ